MKFRKILYIVLSIIITLAAFNPVETAAAKKKTKAKTTQTTGNKSKSGSKKGKASSKTGKSNRNKTATSKSKKGKKSAKNSKGKNSRKKKGHNVVKSTYKEAPKEVPQNDSLTLAVNSELLKKIPDHMNPGGLRINSVKPDKARQLVNISLNENFTYMPLSRALIDSIAGLTKSSLPDTLGSYNVDLKVGGKPLTYYIHKIDKLPEKYRRNPDFVKELNPMVVASKGLDNDIIAMWHSHGRYYKNGSWQWQRPLLFETVEDVYPMSYILPYVVPMLENAGAYVFLPRERDLNRNEVIVDNDTNEEGEIFSQPYYREMNGKHKWETGELEGFIYDLKNFRDTENPFENGTYRQTYTQKGGNPSVAAWYADIPESGEYAVYVSYKTLPNSTSDARYTINYSGGSKEYKVNQQMGGGTWIYLGTFPFESGYSDSTPVVTLTNKTEGEEGTLVTADAIKIGGGMGNIERSPNRSDIYYDPSTPAEDEEASLEEDAEEEEDDEAAEETGDDISDTAGMDIDPSPQPQQSQSPASKGPAPRFTTSGMPRYLEGARYWMHWAGFPEYVYSPFHGRDDYKDDYTGRGHWVNYLAGGSRVLPDVDGMNIPIDVSVALHSDAGKHDNDTFVGTLGIYYTQGGASYKDGTPRINSRMLTDKIMQQIVNDVRREHEPDWTRRSMWDKSYLEARVPEVPTTLLEFMSHQNYADMIYGLDPNFRFTVSRAIYKGIARFLAERKDRKLVIQPLPVRNFAIKRTKANVYRLSWDATPDKLEPTAMPDKYIIMERSGNALGFHKIGETKNTHFEVKINDKNIHTFYVIAANDGGVSFPSERLALREGNTNEKPVLIVNGFTRISAAGHSADATNAGFYSNDDFGVPYIRDISYSGPQNEYRRSAGDRAGTSSQSYITQVIAGNTFDYPALHGRSIANSGLGFVSASVGAVENGEVRLSDYDVVDLILGKQKKTLIGKGKKGIFYPAFTSSIRKELKKYIEKGGDILISGQYAVSDLTDMRSDTEERKFAEEVLGAMSAESDSRKSGKVRDLKSGKLIGYSATLNDKQYIVEKPDVIIPSKENPEVFLTIGDNEGVAGQFVKYGKGNVAVMTIPFESLTDGSERDRLMKDILNRIKK